MRHWVWTRQLCARGLETRPAERRQGLAGFQGTAPSHQSATSAAGVEGGGEAWLGFEARRQATQHTASATGVEGAGGNGGPGRGAGGRWQGLAGLRDDAPRHTPARQSSPVWRAPEGPEGTGGLRDRPLRAAGSRVAISRAAGPDGARNTGGAAINTARQAAQQELLAREAVDLVHDEAAHGAHPRDGCDAEDARAPGTYL